MTACLTKESAFRGKLFSEGKNIIHFFFNHMLKECK